MPCTTWGDGSTMKEQLTQNLRETLSQENTEGGCGELRSTGEAQTVQRVKWKPALSRALPPDAPSSVVSQCCGCGCRLLLVWFCFLDLFHYFICAVWCLHAHYVSPWCLRWDWSHRWLWATMRIPGIEPRSFAIRTSAPYLWAISPAVFVYILRQSLMK